MQNKVIIITGATTGIGRETALALAATGAKLVLIVRSREKADALKAEIAKRHPTTQVHVFLADLSLLEQVQRAGAEVAAQFPVIDVLINNAGAIFQTREETAEGLEMTFALNHLNYFLLTHLLLPNLRAAAAQYGEARIVNVASTAHWAGKVNFNDLQSKVKYSGIRMYCNSKLMNVLFTKELSRRLQGSGVTANSLHPGSVASEFGTRQEGWWFSKLFSIGKPLMVSEAKGAETSIYLATAPEVKGVTGKYFARKKIASTSRTAKDADVAARLWQLSLELCRLTEWK